MPMNLIILPIKKKVLNFRRLQTNHDPITIKKSMIRGSRLMSGTRNSGTKHIMQTCVDLHRFNQSEKETAWFTNKDQSNNQIKQLLPYWD